MLSSHKKERSTDVCSNPDAPRKHAEVKEARHKDHVAYDSVSMKYPELADPCGQEADE